MPGGLQLGFKVVLLRQKLQRGKAELGQSRLCRRLWDVQWGRSLELSQAGGVLYAKAIFYNNGPKLMPRKELDGD